MIVISILSTAQAVIPMITMAALARMVCCQCPHGSDASDSSDACGLAFGVIECLDATTSFLSNLLFACMHHWTGGYDLGLQALMMLAVTNLVLLVMVTWTYTSREAVEQSNHQPSIARSAEPTNNGKSKITSC